MSENSKHPRQDAAPLVPDEEPLPLEADDEPVPVPVPSNTKSGEPQPQKVELPCRKEVSDQKISLVDNFDESAPTKRKAFGSAAAMADGHKQGFKRQLNNNGTGATRCRVFHSKIQENPLQHMETVINDWIDEEGVEVKHATQCIGTMEGKRSESNLLVMVWY